MSYIEFVGKFGLKWGFVFRGAGRGEAFKRMECGGLRRGRRRR